MQINRRITNGLAWAGLIVVVAVPVADAVSGQLMGERPQVAVATVADAAPLPAPLSQRPNKPVIETAAVTPAKPAVPVAAKPAAGSNPVDSFLSSGKALPSYITGGDAAPAQAVTTPAPAVTEPAVAPAQTAAVPGKPAMPASPSTSNPVEMAALTPARIAPVPMPLSMRPTPVTQPLATNGVDDPIVLPPEMLADNAPQPMVVDDLQDWESGPLSEFLAQRQGRQSSATVNEDDAYFVDDRPRHRPRDGIYLGPVEDDGFFPFVN